jgi:hypothetical protein
MAWDDYEIGGVWLLSGDIPFDEMSGVVERLHKEFLERWGRPPYLAELLYPLLSVVAMGPNPAVADARLPSMDALLSSVGGLTAAEHIEPGGYEGAYDGESDDFLILPRAAKAREGMVVRGEVLQPDNRSVICRYEILSPSITDRMAHCLIRYCVLDALLDINLADRDLTIRFERRPPCVAT